MISATSKQFHSFIHAHSTTTTAAASASVAEEEEQELTMPCVGCCFSTICALHAAVAVSCGALMMFYGDAVCALGHGRETAARLHGSTPHDHLLIQTSDSFAGLLLVSIGILLFMVAFVRDIEFQAFFARGCIFIHTATAFWRLYFERRLEDLAFDWPRQLVGDLVLALSWVLFLISSWREKYD